MDVTRGKAELETSQSHRTAQGNSKGKEEGWFLVKVMDLSQSHRTAQGNSKSMRPPVSFPSHDPKGRNPTVLLREIPRAADLVEPAVCPQPVAIPPYCSGQFQVVLL